MDPQVVSLNVALIGFYWLTMYAAVDNAVAAIQWVRNHGK